MKRIGNIQTSRYVESETRADTSDRVFTVYSLRLRSAGERFVIGIVGVKPAPIACYEVPARFRTGDIARARALADRLNAADRAASEARNTARN